MVLSCLLLVFFGLLTTTTRVCLPIEYYSQTGFLPDANPSGGGGSSSQSGAARETRDSSIRPVTIRQMLNSTLPEPNSDVLMLDHKPLRHVRFVGVIRLIHDTSASGTRYRIEDGTGMVEARTFNKPSDDGDGGGGGGGGDGNDDDDGEHRAKAPNAVEFVPDMYVSVFARVTYLQNRHTVTIIDMQPVRDYNQVAYHLLNAIHSHVKNTGGLARATGSGTGSTGDQDLFMSTTGGGVGAGGHNNKAQDAIMAYLRKFVALDSGVHCQQIANDTGIEFGTAKAALDHLSGEGYLYMPEEDHYAITPS